MSIDSFVFDIGKTKIAQLFAEIKFLAELSLRVKQKRQSLGITYSQVAWVMRAFHPEIKLDDVNRFENLDITLEEARKFKNLFEKWLEEPGFVQIKSECEETNFHSINSINCEETGEGFLDSPSKRTPKKRRSFLNRSKLMLLYEYLDENPQPASTQKQDVELLAQKLGLNEKNIRQWLNNKRNCLKNRAIKRENDLDDDAAPNNNDIKLNLLARQLRNKSRIDYSLSELV